jgi:hypothetical protein
MTKGLLAMTMGAREEWIPTCAGMTPINRGEATTKGLLAMTGRSLTLTHLSYNIPIGDYLG